MSQDELVFVPLGGSGEIGMNFNAYGFGPPDDRQWIIVDCGVLFGRETTAPGVLPSRPNSTPQSTMIHCRSSAGPKP